MRKRTNGEMEESGLRIDMQYEDARIVHGEIKKVRRFCCKQMN